MKHYPDVDEHVVDLWRMIGYAAKYGNQPLPALMSSSSSDLVAFNNGVMYWIEKENESSNRGGSGG
jgi:hypothetical protein